MEIYGYNRGSFEKIQIVIMKFLNYFNKDSRDLDILVENAKKLFLNKIDIFKKVDFEWLEGGDYVGEYEYNSSLSGVPKIYLYKDFILSIPKEDLEFSINTTIFHELGHAITNIDNYYIFKEGENILKYEDEEEWVEDFAFNLEMFGKIPKEVKELSYLYKNKMWIGIDENFDL